MAFSFRPGKQPVRPAPHAQHASPGAAGTRPNPGSAVKPKTPAKSPSTPAAGSAAPPTARTPAQPLPPPPPPAQAPPADDDLLTHYKTSRFDKKRKRPKAGTTTAPALPSLATERLIEPLIFAQQRTGELAALLKRRLAATGGSSDIARHLRRRTSSHRRYTLPVRLSLAGAARAAAKAAGVEPHHRCRKHRRRRHILAAPVARLQRPFVRLETHFWHAKRMQMQDIWGHCIPWTMNEQNSGTIRRAAIRGCIIHDQSYFTVVELQGPQPDVLRLLECVIDPAALGMLSAADLQAGRVEREFMLYEPHAFPGKPLGPASIMCRHASTDTLHHVWIWCHPAILATVYKCMRAHRGAVHVACLKHQLLRFSLLGSAVHTVLAKVLHPTTSQPAGCLWQQLCQSGTPASLGAGVCITFDAADPRETRSSPIAPPRSSPQLPALQWPDDAAANVQLWSSAARVTAAKTCPSQRVVCGTRHDARTHVISELEAFIASTPAPAGPAPGSAAAQPAAAFPVMCVQQPTPSQRGYAAGWDIILPAQWGMPVWLACIMAGAHATGLEGYRDVRTEAGMLSFPFDYPDTPAYRDYCEMQAASSKAHLDRIPTGKKPNLVALRSQACVAPDWRMVWPDAEPSTPCTPAVVRAAAYLDAFLPTGAQKSIPLRPALPTLVQCVLRPWTQGVPEPHAMICMPRHEDVAAWTANRKHWLGAEETVGKPQDHAPTRTVIGFATSALNSVVLGHPTALVFVRVDMLAQLMASSFRPTSPHRRSKPDVFVLFRNATAMHYRPAVLTIP